MRVEVAGLGRPWLVAVFDAISAAGWGNRDCAWLPTYWPTHGTGK